MISIRVCDSFIWSPGQLLGALVNRSRLDDSVACADKVPVACHVDEFEIHGDRQEGFSGTESDGGELNPDLIK